MTKLARRAIDLLRKSDRKDETFPAVWDYIKRMTDGKHTGLHALIDAKLDGAADSYRDAIIQTIVDALESGDLRLLEVQKQPTEKEI